MPTKSNDEVLGEVNRIYWLALTKISSEVGRQSKEMRIARQALKDATFLRMAANGASSGNIPCDEEGVPIDPRHRLGT